jgi:ABC-type glycerol-3-phosphate transport system substrate-binding protein
MKRIFICLFMFFALAASCAFAAGVTLNYWLSAGARGPLTPVQQAAIDDWNKANPDIQVKVTGIPFPEYDTKTLAALQAKDGPDILQINSVSLGMFTSQGLVAPMDALLASSTTLKKQNFFPSAWSTVVYNGKAWGLPLDTGTRIIMYNKNLFAKTGVKNFGEFVTWEQLLDAAKRINDPAQGVYGFEYGTGEKWLSLYEGIGHFAIQNGASFISDDMKTVTVNSPQMLETWKFYKALTQYAAPDDINLNDGGLLNSAFQDDKAGLVITGFWNLDSVLQAKPDMNYGLSKPRRKIAGSSTGGWVVAIPSYVKPNVQQAAFKFLSNMFTPQNNGKWTGLMVNQPAAQPFTLKEARYNLFKDVLPASKHPIPLHPKLPTMAEDIRIEMQKVILNQETPEAALISLEAQLTALLK